MCLHDGSGVPRDKTEAYRWFVRSAEQGYPYAQYMLGRYLEEGWAGPKDLDAAATWYERASRQGNSHAKTALERVQPLLKARPATPAPAPSQTCDKAAPARWQAPPLMSEPYGGRLVTRA